jgi:hypothetical protein
MFYTYKRKKKHESGQGRNDGALQQVAEPKAGIHPLNNDAEGIQQDDETVFREQSPTQQLCHLGQGLRE